MEDHCQSQSELERIVDACKKIAVPSPQDIYFVSRDYSQKNPNLTQFSLKLPEGLQNWIDEAQFDFAIATINSHLLRAEKVGCRSIVSSIFNYLTCYVFGVFKKSRMEKALLKISSFIVEQNRNIFHPKGFHMVNPACNGLRHIEIKSITYNPVKNLIEPVMF